MDQHCKLTCEGDDAQSYLKQMTIESNIDRQTYVACLSFGKISMVWYYDAMTAYAF